MTISKIITGNLSQIKWFLVVFPDDDQPPPPLRLRVRAGQPGAEEVGCPAKASQERRKWGAQRLRPKGARRTREEELSGALRGVRRRAGGAHLLRLHYLLHYLLTLPSSPTAESSPSSLPVAPPAPPDHAPRTHTATASCGPYTESRFEMGSLRLEDAPRPLLTRRNLAADEEIGWTNWWPTDFDRSQEPGAGLDGRER
jgi:hypothetical protein